MLRLSVLFALLLLGVCVRSQTAAPFPPLVYTYDGQSAPSSVVEAISTAAEPYNSILAATASDTATGLVGAFPTTATIADTNSPVAATTRDIFSSGNPGEVLSSNTRAPYTKIGTVATVFSSTPTPSATTGTSGSARLEYPSRALMGSCLAMLGGFAAGAMLL